MQDVVLCRQEKVALSSVLVDNACRLLMSLVSELSLTAGAGHVSLLYSC